MAMANANPAGAKKRSAAKAFSTKSEREMRKSTITAREEPATTNTSKFSNSSRNNVMKHTGLPRPRRPLPVPPTSTISTQPPATDSPLSQLHHHTHLLQSLHVRHKNQHRAQSWFKAISLLRRALRNLLDVEVELLELQSPQGQIGAGDARRKLEREKKLIVRKEELRKWIAQSMVPKAYVSASHLVEEGNASFAALGVVIMGVVAGVWRCLGGGRPGDEENDGTVSVRKPRDDDRVGDEMDVQSSDFGTVVERRKIEDTAADATSSSVKNDMEKLLLHEHQQQQEIVVEDEQKLREERYSSPVDKPAEPNRTASQKTQSSSTDAESKKKSKKKNAIDDLFAGFT